jgi:hypothetical protein
MGGTSPYNHRLEQTARGRHDFCWRKRSCRGPIGPHFGGGASALPLRAVLAAQPSVSAP